VSIVVLDQTLAAKEISAVAKGVESAGQSSPLGATVVPGGVNFSVFSRSASSVELLLFDREDDSRPARVIPIDPDHR
jgi:pullulanase/glycogen debranching enzyme